MQAFGNRAAPARLGPLPSTPTIGKALTDLNHGLLRSAFAGQANAILAAPGFRLVERRHAVLNDRRFRREQARWLELGIVARLAWAKERRVCQALRLRLGDGGTLLAANLHATSYEPDSRLAEAEIFRAATFVDGLAERGEPIVFGGDLNVHAGRSSTLEELTSTEWGFERFGAGVDHLLVRGASLTRGDAWPVDRRRLDGRLLSDHPPLEVVLE
jgi:endonuclease/exonuclease/phosphatase (EEP) superfamily protein YafD